MDVPKSSPTFLDIPVCSQEVFPDPVLAHDSSIVKDLRLSDIKANVDLDQPIKFPHSMEEPKSLTHNETERKFALKDLSIEQLCLLLEDQNLQSIKSAIVENDIPGTVLSVSIESVEDLKEIGIKPLQAKTLFKLIEEWKTQGLPAAFLNKLSTTTAKGTYDPSDRSQVNNDIDREGKRTEIRETKTTATDTATSTEVKSVDGTSSEVAFNNKVCKITNEEGTTADDVERWYTAARFCGDTSVCQLLIAAAEKGNHLAEAYLGIIYDKDCTCVAKDASKALLYTQRALPWLQAEVAKGNKYAQFLLGSCLFDGRGVDQNKAEATRLYRLSSDQGHVGAHINLGVCHQYGIEITKDETEAARLYKLAVDQGHVAALNNLGACYAHGNGVTKDEAEAARLYKLAADQGNAAAQFNLGGCYAKGVGVTKDKVKSVELFKLAADQGCADAQFWLGVCYKDGKGVAKNKPEAKKYLKLAADQGFAGAAVKLSQFWF